MATYDPYSDSPFKIKHEGQEIVVRQNRLSSTTIRVSWTVPNAVSCQLPTAYNGVIVTLDRTPTALDKLPKDGVIYKADPTADKELHAGDAIGTALIVGAFYDDTKTTYVDVIDAATDEPFYISVHAVDQQYRYHTDGVHSYSLPYGKKEDLPTPSYQVIKMGASGITADTLTTLDPNTTYQFQLRVTEAIPNMPIAFHGANAVTYGNLVDEINNAILLQQAPSISEIPPGDGKYWIDTTKKIVYKIVGSTAVYQPSIITALDPVMPTLGAYWYSGSADVLSQWDNVSWNTVNMHSFGRDPRNPFCNDYWTDGTSYYKWNGGAWIKQVVITTNLDPQLPPVMHCGMYWFVDGTLYQWSDKTCKWIYVTNDVDALTGDVRFNVDHVEQFDVVDKVWISMPTYLGTIDPSKAPTVQQGTLWVDSIDGKVYNLDGTSWVAITVITNPTKPQAMQDGAIWHNTYDTFFYKLQMGLWTRFAPVLFDTAPTELPVDTVWFNPSVGQLKLWDGAMWILQSYTTSPIQNVVGDLWYNPNDKQMFRWDGKTWLTTSPIGSMSINASGDLVLTSGITGSISYIYVTSTGNLWNTQALTPLAMLQEPIKGTDPISSVPSYLQIGVGTDGSQDERRQMIQRIKGVLGWPSVEVELTKEQMDTAIDMALEVLRARSSSAYKRGYFALQLLPRVQKYKLTDATVGYNKIVDIFYVYRAQATFLGTAQGNSVYGQMAVQQLFNMGKFDLLSYHLVSSYIKTMQQLFASEIQFTWNERDRELWIMKDFTVPEQVIVDCELERTEQDLLTDRWTRNWLQVYATAQCRYILADIRGKYTVLPGAGGNVSLNAADLRQRADMEIQQCMDDIDNNVVNDKVNVGVGSDFVLG